MNPVVAKEVTTFDTVVVPIACILIMLILGFACGQYYGAIKTAERRVERMDKVEKALQDGSSAFARLIYSAGNQSVCRNNNGLKAVHLAPPNDKEFTFLCQDGAKFEFIELNLRIAGVH